MMFRSRGYITLLLITLLLISFACIQTASEDHDKPEKDIQTDLSGLPVENIEYEIDKVVDGDTIRLVSIDEPVRLLCVDTEEVFRNYNQEEKKEAYEDWETYEKRMNTGIHHKFPTPFGEDASEFLVDLLDDIETVRIEYESEDRKTGFFDRPLGYVFAIKNGAMFNVNLEMVRNGFSPYYTKYGYSEKYHDDFVNAENQAKASESGVWNQDGKHYSDYDERTEFWNLRADQISYFQTHHSTDETYFCIQNETDWERLDNYLDTEITCFGTIDSIRKTGPPYRSFMSHKQGRSLLLQTFYPEIHNVVLDTYSDQTFIYCTGYLQKNDKGYNLTLDDLSDVKPTETEPAVHD